MFFQAWCRVVRVCFVVISLFSGSIFEPCISSPRLEPGDRDYNGYLLKYKKWAESGVTHIDKESIPLAVEFDVQETDLKKKHRTLLRACRYYQVGDKKTIVDNKTIICDHILSSNSSTQQDLLYIDTDKVLYRPATQTIHYLRPAMPLIALEEAAYSLQQFIFAGHEANACALLIREAGTVVQNPLIKFYKVENETQLLSPYMYSDGAHFTLTRVYEAQCQHIETGRVFDFSYIVSTPHKLVLKPGCRLMTLQGEQTTEFPIDSALDKGLYQRRLDDRWIQLNNQLQPIESDKSYLITHSEGPWIHEARVCPFGDSNVQVLNSLKNTSYLQHISGIDFGRRSYTLEEQGSLCELFKRMGHLTHINLASINPSFNYKSIVPKLIKLPHLTYIDVTNCELSEKYLKHLKNPTVTYDFAKGQEFPFKHRGFSKPERNLRWTEGYRATFKIPVMHKNHRIKSITFKNTGANITQRHSQFVHVSVNGTLAGVYRYDFCKGLKTICAPIPEDTDIAKIAFDLPDAISPTALRKKRDPRILGIYFKDIELSLSTFVYHLGIENGFPFLLSGFSVPEETHRWTEGHRAFLQVPGVRNNRKLKKISFRDTEGLVTPDHSQSLTVFLNGTPTNQYHYDIHHNCHTIDIQIPDTCELANVEFDVPRATTPTEVGVNLDSRTLGVSFSLVELWYPITVIE